MEEIPEHEIVHPELAHEDIFTHKITMQELEEKQKREEEEEQRRLDEEKRRLEEERRRQEEERRRQEEEERKRVEELWNQANEEENKIFPHDSPYTQDTALVASATAGPQTSSVVSVILCSVAWRVLRDIN